MSPLSIPGILCVVALTGCSAARRPGVYTLVQAESGEASYGRHCASCHGPNLEGNEDFCTRPLQGPQFWRRWGGQSVGDLYDRIRKSMPENRPGSLGDQEYAAIVSFILKANELPAGAKDLPSDSATLRRMVMTNQKEKK